MCVCKAFTSASLPSRPLYCLHIAFTSASLPSRLLHCLHVHFIAFTSASLPSRPLYCLNIAFTSASLPSRLLQCLHVCFIAFTSALLPGPVGSIALSNDGNCVLASCLCGDAGRLTLLEKASGEVLNSYVGHVNVSYHVGSCFTNTDAYVASGSEDGRIVFWDLVEVSPERCC